LSKENEEKTKKKEIEWKPDEKITMTITKGYTWTPDMKLKMKISESLQKKEDKENQSEQ
jgi:hypothetical protein